MSNEDLLKQDPLVAPADSDEQFIIRLEYEDPIRKASIWLHKLIIHRLRDVQLAAPWYRGETDEPRRKPQKRPEPEKDSAAVRRDDDTGRVITEINKRHRNGAGSYAKIIGAMTKDPVWGARMRHMSARTWKSRAIEHKKK